MFSFLVVGLRKFNPFSSLSVNLFFLILHDRSLKKKGKGQRQKTVSWTHTVAAGKEGIDDIN